MQDVIKMKKNKLLFYEKGKREELESKLLSQNIKIYPISYLTDKNLNLKYVSISNEEHFVLDITTLVLSALVRNDLRIIYEGWINALSDSDDEVEFCIEKSCLHAACEMFYDYLETDEKFDDVNTDKNEEESIETELKEDNDSMQGHVCNSIVQYDKTRLESLMCNFDIQLYGHEGFKIDLKKKLHAFMLLYKMKRRKVFSMLLCGKSGIGKTEVARILQKEMYSEEPAIKINFGNYSGKGSLWSLIGSPKGYIGSEQGGELTNKIIHSNSKLIVIDELDKADDSIYTFFYEMLEDGQFTDLDGKIIDLDGYIIVFTANLNNSNFKDLIPEPLFSRFDMTYEFQPLSTEEKTKFTVNLIDGLIIDYHTEIGELDGETIKNRIVSMRFEQSDNLRNIKRDIMNSFVDLVMGDEIK